MYYIVVVLLSSKPYKKEDILFWAVNSWVTLLLDDAFSYTLAFLLIFISLGSRPFPYFFLA